MHFLASVYIPPPFNTEILSELTSFTADNPGVPVIVTGDFNMAMDNCLDRFPARVASGGLSRGPLLQFCEEVGWVDIWRKWHPGVKQYSCHTRTHATLSRIDLALCNEEALKIVVGVDYEPRGLSDHSPVVLSIRTGLRVGGGEWKLNPLWLKVIEDDGGIVDNLKEFIILNSGSAPARYNLGCPEGVS